MKQYELLTLVSATLSEKELTAAQDAVRTLLEKNRASITKHQVLEKRKLSYSIRHESQGIYLLTHFDADPASIRSLDVALRLEKPVLRHMITQYVPKSARAFEREHLRETEAKADKPIITKEALEEKLEKILTEDVIK